MGKPPAFQFYAKDWRSSSTVKLMNYHQRGLYIDMLAAAWDSDEPGSLPLPLEIAARSVGCDVRSLRDLLSKFPRCFVQVGSHLVNDKLVEQARKYQEISKKRTSAANLRHHANASSQNMQVDHSAFAVASASATATKDKVKSVPPAHTAGDEFELFWDAYPKKLGRQEAHRVWKQNRTLLEGHIGDVLESLRAWQKADQWRDAQFIPYPATWLSKGMFKETPRASPQTAGGIDDERLEELRRRRRI
jgi:hypothetical protein